MGNLPTSRVTPSPPFLHTGIVYAGAFTIRSWRGLGYKTSKCWVAMIICFATRAVHIELVSGLESQAFLATLRRFIARRGKPKALVSDNANTFHGANNQLTEIRNVIENSNELYEFCTNAYMRQQ